MWVDELKRMKARTGLTTAQISAGAGIPEPTLEKLFAGTTKDPKLPTMQKLVKFLGGTLDDLYQDEKPQEVKEPPGASVDAERVYSFLLDAGLVKASQDLTDTDLIFIESIAGLIRLWFENRHQAP